MALMRCLLLNYDPYVTAVTCCAAISDPSPPSKALMILHCDDFGLSSNLINGCYRCGTLAYII